MPTATTPSMSQSIKSMKWNTPFKAYQKILGNNPLLESAVLGSLMGYGAYKGTDYAARFGLKNFAMRGRPKAEIDQVMAEAKKRGSLRNFALALGGAGAMAGAAYPIIKNYDPAMSG